jgi:spore germination cell wall hydrolase CwlJ-like protein
MKILTFSLVLATVALVPRMIAVNTADDHPSIINFDYVNHVRKQECLAQNIYHEARGESQFGMIAVAYVTMNRVYSEDYPDDVCDVVYQGKADSNGNPVRHKCQFSWYCDGKSDKITEEEVFLDAKHVASYVIHHYDSSLDPTAGATMYHSVGVTPYWADSFEKTNEIENHIFYR